MKYLAGIAFICYATTGITPASAGVTFVFPLGPSVPPPAQLELRDTPDMNFVIDEWFERVWRYDDAMLQAWLHAERDEAWLSAERQVLAAKAAPPAYRPSWLHAWISDEILNELGMCESTNRYDVNTGNGFYGRVQWMIPTWNAAAARAGRPDLVGIRPDLVAPSDQDAITKYWWSVSDYRGQWPVCGPRAIARAG